MLRKTPNDPREEGCDKFYTPPYCESFQTKSSNLNRQTHVKNPSFKWERVGVQFSTQIVYQVHVHQRETMCGLLPNPLWGSHVIIWHKVGKNHILSVIKEKTFHIVQSKQVQMHQTVARFEGWTS